MHSLSLELYKILDIFEAVTLYMLRFKQVILYETAAVGGYSKGSHCKSFFSLFLYGLKAVSGFLF